MRFFARHFKALRRVRALFWMPRPRPGGRVARSQGQLYHRARPCPGPSLQK